MDLEMKEKFIDRWSKYFNEAPLPIVFYYTDDPGDAEVPEKPERHHCIVADMNKVTKGKTLAFNQHNLGCPGANHYLGYNPDQGPDFRYFLSCGIEGKMEGERYKKTPELVDEMMKDAPHTEVKDQWIVFKRWDKLEEKDQPEVVIFFAEPDALAGLFMLANFDREDPYGVKTPMGSGCATTIQYPYAEREMDNQSGFIGMFDPSARPYVKSNILTFSTPMRRFEQLIEQMDESFLITSDWGKVKKRL